MRLCPTQVSLRVVKRLQRPLATIDFHLRKNAHD